MTKISAEGFNLRRGVAGAMLAVTAVAMVGCDLSTGDVSSNGVNQFVRIRNPIGHVQGVVVDSNNRPIQGATVRIGARVATTNAGGTYEFRNLEVTNTYSGDEIECDSECINDFLITVVPPAVTTVQTMQYLGAIVSVSAAQAQFQSFGSEFSGSGDEALDATGTQTFFIDGFRVQAKTAVLPEIGASAEVIGIRSVTTGQALNGVQASLDFVGVSATEESDEGFNTECDSGCAVQYPTVSWSGTITDGELQFTNLAANSDYNLHYNRHVCVEPDEDNNDSGNAETADTCGISTRNETELATFRDYRAIPIEDSGDDIEPYIEHVVGVYEVADAMLETECSDVDTDPDDIGILTRNIDGTTGINFRMNEAIDPTFVGIDSVALRDVTNEAYVDVASVSVNDDVVTVTTTDALEEGIEFDVYFFRPDFPDLAGNVIEVNAEGIEYNCDGNASNWTGFLAVSLHTFAQPSTSVDVATPVQEIEDPVDNDEDNDLADPQDSTVSLTDANDNEDDSIQQLNAPEDGGNGSNDNLPLAARIVALGESTLPPPAGLVEADVARIEWLHVDGARGYVISVPEADDEEEEALEDFDNDYFNAGDLDGTASLTIGTVDRGGTDMLFAINENRFHGDEMCVAAVDDLGHAGEPGCVTVLDLIEPTTTIQRSYQHVHDYDDLDIAGETLPVEDDASGGNISGCWNRMSGFGPEGAVDHAGVVLGTATDEFGDGGEQFQEGADQQVGSLCIGIAPELLMDADVDSDDYDPHGAHDALTENRATAYTTDTVADPNTTLPNDNATDGDYKNAYDEAGFTAWVRPPVAMGAAVTENLSAVGTPTLTGITAALSAFDFENDVVTSHLGEDNFFIEDLVTFQVDDAYVLANTDHGGTIDFAGAITDEAGNTASTDANAVLFVRDMWPPYITSGQRNADGTITLVFDSDIYIEDDDSDDITLIDHNGTTDITLEVDDSGNFENFDYDDGTFTLTIHSEGLPDQDDYDNRFVDDELSYPSAAPVQHVLVDYREITDKRGNKWENHDFEGDVSEGPRFLLPDLLDTFDVTESETAADPDSGPFDIVFTATHPICNPIEEAVSGDLLDSSTVADLAECDDDDAITAAMIVADNLWRPSDDDGSGPPDLTAVDDDGNNDCNENADGSVDCDFDTAYIYVGVTYDFTSGDCDLFPGLSGEGSLNISADHTTLTFTFTCEGATEVQDTDNFDGVVFDDDAYSAYDGTNVTPPDVVDIDTP